jgi:hypothetical protein
MKREFVSNHVLKAIAGTATLVLLILGNPLASHAANGPVKEKIGRISDNQVSAQFLGADQESYVFRVEFENPEAQKFSFIIKNDDDVTVYEGQFSDVHFSKTVRLPKDEVVLHPTFIIHTSKGDVKRSFSVNRTVSESLVVTKS